MADKDNDEDKFDDDEDFGLPELHYEELDEDDASGKEEEKPGDPEEPEDPFADQSSSESTEGSFYEEESFDEFKEDSSTSSGSVFDSDDSPDPDTSDPFGDSSESSAFGDESYTQPSEQEPYADYYNEDSSKKAKSNFTRIVIIGTLLFASIAIVFVFFIGDSDLFSSEEEVQPAPAPEPVVEETVVDSSAFQNVQPEPVTPEPPSQPIAGTVTTLEQQTGKSYVVIGSFFDGDLAMDYANVLAKNGNSPQIIPPFKDYRFYRVAIAEFDSFRDAEAQAPSYAEQFGREAWPLRY